MALFNVDKAGESRSAPTVNAVDVHHNRKAHATDSIAPRAVGTETGGRVVEKNDTITVYDSDNYRVAIGRLPNGEYGVAITKSGYDITDAIT